MRGRNDIGETDRLCGRCLAGLDASFTAHGLFLFRGSAKLPCHVPKPCGIRRHAFPIRHIRSVRFRCQAATPKHVPSTPFDSTSLQRRHWICSNLTVLFAQASLPNMAPKRQPKKGHQQQQTTHTQTPIQTQQSKTPKKTCDSSEMGHEEALVEAKAVFKRTMTAVDSGRQSSSRFLS